MIWEDTESLRVGIYSSMQGVTVQHCSVGCPIVVLDVYIHRGDVYTHRAVASSFIRCDTNRHDLVVKLLSSSSGPHLHVIECI